MKILFLADDFPPQSFGGAGFSTYELAQGMKSLGHEVVIVTTCREDKDAGEYEQDGLKVLRIRSDYNIRYRAYISLMNKVVLEQLEQILKKVRPDIVHANNIHTYISYAALKISKKYAKVVITLRDTMAFTYGKLSTEKYLKKLDPKITWLDNLKTARKRWNPFRNILIKKYLGYADKIFAISGSLKAALEKNCIKNVSVIYNGIDIEEWQISEEKVREFKTKFSLEDKKVIFYNARLSPEKGSEVVLEMIEKVKMEVSDAVLLVAGNHEGPGKTSVIFTGWLSRGEIRAAYGSADVVVMPSIYLDAFGRVNIEAMASKKPVVGTCFGGTPEIIEDGVTGYVVDPLNTEEFAGKVLYLLRDEKKAKIMGEAGFLRVTRFFELKDKVNEYLSQYKKLLEANTI